MEGMNLMPYSCEISPNSSSTQLPKMAFSTLLSLGPPRLKPGL